MSKEITVSVESAELAKKIGVSTDLVDAMDKINAIVSRVTPQELAQYSAAAQPLILAKSMVDLRKVMSQDLVEKVFSPLQGTKLGFKTDLDSKGGYAWDVVRDVMIEGMIRGFRPVGNEINIIASNFYGTQEGFDRKVNEFPGLTNLELSPGVPVLDGGQALVSYDATWLLNGNRDRLSLSKFKTDDGEVVDRRIPVKVNNGQGADATLGKTKRKMLARIYERLSGVKIYEGDAIEASGETVSERSVSFPARGAAAKASAIVSQHKIKDDVAPAESAPAMREPGQEG